MKTHRYFPKNIRWLRWFGTILSTGLFIWLLSRQDWVTLWSILRSLPVWLLPLAFGLYLSAIIGNSVRWYILLRVQSQEITFSEILKIEFAGNFASNFLPSTIGGDTVRVVGAARLVGWPVSMASVIADRAINVLAMVCFLPVLWIVYPTLSLELGRGDILMPDRISILLGSVVPSFYNRVIQNLKKWMTKIIDALRIWRHQPGTVIGAFVISILARLTLFLGIYLLAQGMKIEVTFFQVIGAAVITYFLSLLPVSINGFGLREVTMTTLYIQFGASLEQASALVIVTRFILMSETLPGAFWVSDKLVAKTKEVG
jgi:uncharacterized membrane protein YbhN (UPF0104 family)